MTRDDERSPATRPDDNMIEEVHESLEQHETFQAAR
jgi:hypothetical protein